MQDARGGNRDVKLSVIWLPLLVKENGLRDSLCCNSLMQRRKNVQSESFYLVHLLMLLCTTSTKFTPQTSICRNTVWSSFSGQARLNSIQPRTRRITHSWTRRGFQGERTDDND